MAGRRCAARSAPAPLRRWRAMRSCRYESRAVHSAAMTTVGIVSPGAMGSAVGNALLRGGARVVATVDGRSARTVELARRADLELLPDLAAVVREADVVLSIVSPAEAGRVAAAVAGARLFADLNAIAPARAVRISPEADGSISGGPPWRAGTTRIYLSGPRADEVAAL